MNEPARRNGLEARVTALEHKIEELDQLVDGWEHPRSHRHRLHKLEGDVAAIALAREVLRQRGRSELAWADRIRESAVAIVAIAAIVVAWFH